MKARRTYTGKKGFFGIKSREFAPPDCLGSSSVDALVDPYDGRITARDGFRTYANAGGVDYTNLLGAYSGLGATWRGRGRIQQLYSRATDVANYDRPWCVLFADEALNYGVLYFSEEDPGTAGSVPCGLVSTSSALAAAYWYDEAEMMPGLGLGGRFISLAQKCAMAAGSRNFIETPGWMAFPGFGVEHVPTVPTRWNKEWVNATPLAKPRAMPLGPMPPIYPMAVTPTAGAGPWANGDKFYYGVLFEGDDGLFGPMTQFRPPGPVLTTGFGYFTLAASATSLTFTVPLGPKGTRRRHLVRSIVVNGASAEPDPSSIGIVHTLDDNVRTTFVDAYPGAEQITDFPEGVRLDHMWAPPARYGWAFDQRYALGYIQPNPAAILFAAYENTLGFVDDDTIKTSYGFYHFVSLSGTNLRFTVWDGNTLGGAGVSAHWDLALTGLTLQDVVDRINAWNWGATAAPWTRTLLGASPPTNFAIKAALAPGADSSALATEMAAFGAGHGDGFSKGGTPFDYQRIFGNGLPGLARMGSTWQSRYTAKRNVLYFTGGGPGHAANAIDAWYVGNFREAPESIGDIVGGAPLLDGCMVLGTRGAAVLRNLKDGKSGFDDDYRIEVLDGLAGCIAPDTIVQLNDAVGWLSPNGFVVADGNGARPITDLIYDPGLPTEGELGIIIPRCAADANRDLDAMNATASVVGSQLMLCYDAYGTGDWRTLLYDFSPAKEMRGVAQFFGPDGDAFPWSTPLQVDVANIGHIQVDGERIVLGLRKSSTASGSAGAVRRLQGGHDKDQGQSAVVQASVEFMADDFGARARKSLLDLDLRYTFDGSTGDMTLGIATNGFQSIVLPAQTVTPYDRIRFPAPLARRGPAQSLAFDLYIPHGASAWDLVARAEVLEAALPEGG